MYEDRWRRPLAFLVDSLEQLASLFYWSDSSVEEGAWAWQAYSFLVGFLAIIFQWGQFQSDDISWSFVTTEGFSILASQMISGAFTVVLAVYMRGAPSRGASTWGSLYINSLGVAIVSGSIIYCVYCNLYLLFLIYTFRSQTGFPRGGFVQGSIVCHARN